MGAVARDAWVEVVVVQRALAGAEPAERAAAVEWCAAHVPDGLPAVASQVFDDPDPVVRAVAAVVYRTSPDAAIVERARLTLRELLAGDDAARHAGLRAAARLGNPFTIPRLFQFLDHPDPETRQLALAAIAAPDPGLVAPEFLRARVEPLLADPVLDIRVAARRLVARIASARR